MAGKRAAGPPDAIRKIICGQDTIQPESLTANGSLPDPTRIKICGLTRLEDIAAVNRQRPDFAGFVLAESKRRVTPDQVRDLIAELNPAIIPVGVFVDRPSLEVAEIALFCSLGAVQLHGRETNGEICRLRALLPAEVLIIKALRVKDSASLAMAGEIPADLLLLDAYSPGAAGGTGTSFPWEWVQDLTRPYLLAGGLDGETVQQAIALLQPWGVDVSSGVETDGLKDEGKIADFIKKVRE